MFFTREVPGNPHEMITMAERRFPVRIRIAVPPDGVGQRYAPMTACLDENCGADGWAMTPVGTRGVLNDAASIYFLDTTLAGAFVARWYTGWRRRGREDDPAPRVGGALHWTPWGKVRVDAPLRVGVALG
jgi:hypothetical protein